MPTYRSWGQVFNPSFRHSGGDACPSCLWELSGWAQDGTQLPKGYWTYVVGFTLDAPPSVWPDIVVGALIIECPQCFEKFWFHCTKEMLKTAVRLGAWPPANSD